MLHVVMFAVLAATPDARTPEPVKLASTGFSAVNINQDLATFYADHFAQRLALEGFRVLTASEISAVVGFERQKELMGCKDNSASCMTELANALGVDGLVVGSLAKFDTSYQVNLKIVGSQNAAPLAVFSGEAEGDKGVVALLNNAAKQMAPQVNKALGRQPSTPATATATTPAADAPTSVASSAAPASGTSGTAKPAADVSTTTTTSSGRRWPWIPTVVGAVAIGAGGFLVGQSYNELATVQENRAENLNDVNQRIEMSQRMRPAGMALMVAGGAALATSAVLFFLSGDAPAQPQAVLTPNGASVGVVGVLP